MSTGTLRNYLAAVARIAQHGVSAGNPHENQAAAIILARDLPRAVEDHRDYTAPTTVEYGVPMGGAAR